MGGIPLTIKPWAQSRPPPPPEHVFVCKQEKTTQGTLLEQRYELNGVAAPRRSVHRRGGLAELSNTKNSVNTTAIYSYADHYFVAKRHFN